MKITKLGHSCLLVEESGVQILFDPGNYTTEQNKLSGLDAIIITQTHADHFDMESVKAIRVHNPMTRIITNSEVAAKLKVEGIDADVVEDGQQTAVNGVSIEAFGKDHAPIHPVVPAIVNTGYMIAGRFYNPGDGYFVPPEPVEILALPVGGPWVKISEAVDFAEKVKPQVCFPIHDGGLKKAGGSHAVPEKVLTPLGTRWFVPEPGVSFTV